MSKRSKACEFTPKVRRAIKDRDRGRCIFCSLLGNSGYPATQIMHYVGRAQGGLGVEKNGALGCVYHHQQLDNSDKRDAMKIAKCLAYNTYSTVHVPTKEDSDIKEYVRMRDAHKTALKKVKQQILAFCTRHGFKFSEGRKYWTQKHMKWLRDLKTEGLLREILSEYLATYTQETDKVERFDRRIAELAEGENYAKKVHMLSCMIGIRTHTALSLLVETGDFHRFKKAEQYAAFLGLVPGEHSSGDGQNRLGITKRVNIVST